MNQIDLLSGEPAPIIFDYLQDPGHGWIAVPMDFVRFYGVAKDISAYSYISRDGATAYLEEDCDAGRLLQAAKAAGLTVELREHHSNGDSFIRRLPGYPAQPRLIG